MRKILIPKERELKPMPIQFLSADLTMPSLILTGTAGAPMPSIVLQNNPDLLDYATFALLLVGFLITMSQLRVLIRQHSDNHKWNRRKAAEDACNQFSDDLEFRILLTKHLDLGKSTEPIPVAEIERIVDQLNTADPQNKPGAEIGPAIHRLLNFYESFARGIAEGVYDEKIIKRAMKGQMKQAKERFGLYIKNRRKVSDNDLIWDDFIAIVDMWSAQDGASRTKKSKMP